MSTLLAALGATLAAAAIVRSRRGTAASAPSPLPGAAVRGLAIAALIIVAFATKSAMGI